MNSVILDCYTDEPAGLGVPPSLGTYPRYLFGALNNPTYLTIDDLRLYLKYKSVVPKKQVKTDIRILNLTRNWQNVAKILENTDELIAIAGIQTPGKYLTAMPGTLFEINEMVKDLRCTKILTGPAASTGTRLEGGKFAEKVDTSCFDEIDENYGGIDDYGRIKELAVKGAAIVKQIPYPIIAELETGRGCLRKNFCSFCTEPLKHKLEWRNPDDIFAEAKALREAGVKYFRLGKQSCFYSYKNGNTSEMEKLLKFVASLKPDVLHIDNADPAMVDIEKTKLIVKYCTPGNIAAFGVESFDNDVIKQNNLNSNPEMVLEAVKIINEIGGKRGENGMHYLLPGINILFGLIGESKKTHEENMHWLKKILDSNLLLRRINIRQVAIFDGTKIKEEAGNKFLRKNNKYYWKWRNAIRQEIDFPMLKKLLPEGTILKNLRTEIHDGNTTFARQFGTYPLIVGIKKRLPLGEMHDVKVTGHMLRSVVGEVV